MPRRVHHPFALLVAGFVALYGVGGWAHISRPYVKGEPRAAEFVSLDDQLVQFRVDGQLVRIPRAMLHSFRAQQGQLQFRFTGGMVLTVPAQGKGPIPDSDWAEFPSGKNGTPPVLRGVPPAPADKRATDASKLRETLLQQIERQQRAYRELSARHRKRMHDWFSAMDRAERDGAQSAALSSDTQFQTRRLAESFAGKLAVQQEELVGLEQIVRQLPQSGGDPEAARQCLERLRTLEKQHAELAVLADQLDDDLARNYRRLRGYES